MLLSTEGLGAAKYWDSVLSNARQKPGPEAGFLNDADLGHSKHGKSPRALSDKAGWDREI